MAFLSTLNPVQNMKLPEPAVELWKWRKKDQLQIDIARQLQPFRLKANTDLIVNALDHDFVFLSRPEQAFFGDFYKTETSEALKDWYQLDTAYFKQTMTRQTSHYNVTDHLSSPVLPQSFYNLARRPINVIRPGSFFKVVRASYPTPRLRFSPYLHDHYANWQVGTPLSRELLLTFFKGGLTSTRQLPHLPLMDKHFIGDLWETISRYKNRLRPNLFRKVYGQPTPVTVSNQLALSQAKTPGVAGTNEIFQFYHRGLTKQQGIAAAYDKFLRDWQTLKSSEGVKPVFTASFWYHLPKGFMDYVVSDQDRIRFLKNKNLSFPAEQFARVRTLKAYQQYARQVPHLIGDMATKPHQKWKYWRFYYNQYLRRFGYFYRFLQPNERGPLPLFFSGLNKKYGFRVKKAFHLNPISLHTTTLLNGIETPDEQLNILLEVLKSKGQGGLDSNLLFDYVYSDLSQLNIPYPQLTTREMELELSLPGIIISPSEFRDYWTGVQRYKKAVEEKTVLLNTLQLLYRQDKMTLNVLPVMGALKHVNFYRLKQRFSFFNRPDFNPWEGFIESAGITVSELKALGLFLSGALPARQFFTPFELPVPTPEKLPTLNPQHTQPLFHWNATLSRLKPKQKTASEKFRDDVDQLLNQAYISPMLRKFFNLVKMDFHSLGVLKTIGFVLDDDYSGLDLLGKNGLNHQSRRSQPNTKYLPSMFQKRVERYASLISDHRIHLETNVLPPIVYAETPESFIDLNMKKIEFEKERKYVAKRMKAYNDKIFKPLDYLRYPRLKERHRQRQYFWYCHHFVNNWGSINLDPKEVALIGQTVLIPDLQTRNESVKRLIPVFLNYPNPVGLNNYMTTYSYKTIEMCLVAFDDAEKKRVSEETTLRAEVEYIKQEYAGKYYKEIREELLEPLLEQLARIEYERQTQLALPLWPNSGKPGLWRYEAVDDIELLFDTQDEINTLQNVSWNSSLLKRKRSVYPLNTTRHTDYRDYQLTAFGMYSYSSWSNKMRYSDFQLDHEDETRFSETKRTGRRANLNLLYLQKKQNSEIIRYLTQDDNLQTEGIRSFFHQMRCYRDTLGSKVIEHNDVRDVTLNRTMFWGHPYVNFWDSLSGIYFTTEIDQRAYNTPINVTAQPSHFTSWVYRNRSLIPRYKDQLLLTGYYNVTQRFPTSDRLLTQGTSVITPIDLFGTFSEQSLGLHPYEWFDIYDPVSERILKVAPNSSFLFKNNLFLKRYTGFYRPTPHSETLCQPQGLVENLEHLASGFVDLESQVGRELAVTQLLFKTFGILPYQIFEFFTFATVWGQNWLAAIYNGSFVESHYKEWSYMTVTDGLFDLTESNTKNVEARLRSSYRKIVNAKLYSDTHLSTFLAEQEAIVTDNHWRQFLTTAESKKSVKVL
jgi:hypothetical protein